MQGPYDINLREYWRILKKRKLTVVLVAAAMGLFTILFAALRAPEPVYTSVCTIEFQKQTGLEGLYGGGYPWTSAPDIDTQISVIKGYPVMRLVAEKLGKLPRVAAAGDLAVEEEVARVLDRLQSKVEVEREAYTRIIRIEASDASPVFAKELANTVALSYKEAHRQARNRRISEALQYIANRMSEARVKLIQAEDAFNRFTREKGLLSVDMEGESLLSRKRELEAALAELEDGKKELTSLRSRLEAFMEEPYDGRMGFYSNHAGKEYQETSDSLTGLLLRRESLLETLTSRHPKVVAINRKILESARKMVFLLDTQINTMTGRHVAFEKELSELEEKTDRLMEKRTVYNRLKRRVESGNEMIAMLEEKHQEVLIRRAEQPDEITIVRPAFVPDSPVNAPRSAATGGLGVGIGLFLGMLVAFVAETFDTSLGAIDDVEDTLKTRVMGVIPHGDIGDIQAGGNGGSRSSEEASFRQKIHLVSHFAPKSMLAESFRGLRLNLQSMGEEAGPRTVVVTSAAPEEGKTVVAANLATAMAQGGMRTLLVEGDLRRPNLAQVLGIENGVGLSDVLAGNRPWREAVKTITDIMVGEMGIDDAVATPGLDNLHVITAGNVPRNPAELIDSAGMSEFMEAAEAEYDRVVFDSPPVLSTADPATLGRMADGALLVYRVGTVSRRLLKRATVQLGQADTRLIGVVLNSMRAAVSPDFEDFKYYKYYYNGEDGESVKKKAVRKASGHRKKLLLLMALIVVMGVLLWRLGMLPIDRFMGSLRGESVEKDEVARETISRPISTPESLAIEPEAVREIILPIQESEPEVLPEPQKHPYAVHLASFRKREDALSALDAYRERGLSPYWARVDLGEKGKWYRIFAGTFTDLETAREFEAALELEGTRVLKTAYAVLVKGARSEKERAGLPETLGEEGRIPYRTDEAKNAPQWLVGAFLSREGAENLAKDLQSGGFRCEVVER